MIAGLTIQNMVADGTWQRVTVDAITNLLIIQARTSADVDLSFNAAGDGYFRIKADQQLPLASFNMQGNLWLRADSGTPIQILEQSRP